MFGWFAAEDVGHLLRALVAVLVAAHAVVVVELDVALDVIASPVYLFPVEEFERGEGVDHEVGRESDEQEVYLRHEQPDAENGHEATVDGPHLYDDVARDFGIREVFGFLVLDGVEEKGGERVAEEVVETRAGETGHGHHEPPVPCVDGERHDFCGG